MSINLVKGQKINLVKDGGGALSKIVVGLGWDVAGDDSDFDCDACAILCGAGGKTKPTKEGDVVWWNNLKHSSGSIYHTGDNRTGEGEGDDEQIVIDLPKVPAQYEKIVIAVSIYKGREKGQNFGQINNAFVRAVDAGNNKEIFRYDLTEDYSGNSGMIFGEIYRHNGQWKFNAIGRPVPDGSYVERLVEQYL
jgi:stress response protein SCP2